jgi:hypothetical protein
MDKNKIGEVLAGQNVDLPTPLAEKQSAATLSCVRQLESFGEFRASELKKIK